MGTKISYMLIVKKKLVGFNPTSIVGGDVKRYIRLWVSPPTRLIFWEERANVYCKSNWSPVGLGWWAETLVQRAQQMLQLVSEPGPVLRFQGAHGKNMTSGP
jgi:hypothetical protein